MDVFRISERVSFWWFFFSFQGSTEPSTLPAMLGSSLSVLVPVMCRTLELTASHTHDIEVGVNILSKMRQIHEQLLTFFPWRRASPWLGTRLTPRLWPSPLASVPTTPQTPTPVCPAGTWTSAPATPTSRPLSLSTWSPRAICTDAVFVVHLFFCKIEKEEKCH